MSTLGKRIATARRGAGKRRVWLAEASGIAPRTLAAYEQDYRLPPADVLRRIASALETTCGALLDDEAQP